MQSPVTSTAGITLPRLYFTAVSTITLFMLMFSGVDLINIGLKSFVIKSANMPDNLESCNDISSLRTSTTMPETPPINDETLRNQCESRNQTTIENYKRTTAGKGVQAMALVLVSLPLFLIHFRITLRDWKSNHGK